MSCLDVGSKKVARAREAVMVNAKAFEEINIHGHSIKGTLAVSRAFYSSVRCNPLTKTIKE